MTSSPKRFLASGLNSAFTFAGASFADYINQTQAIIRKARLDLASPQAQFIVNANSPFEWRPENPKHLNPRTGRFHNGVLLIHGLYDSPCLMQSLGKYFKEKGFLVRALLLPGHGTIPGDLLSISYQEWIKATQFGVDSFRKEADNLYLACFSMGGTLAIHHAFHNAAIKGLLLFSPALKIRHQLAFVLNHYTHLLTLAGTIFKKAQWFYINDDQDYAKYESFTFNAAYQTYLLIEEVIKLSAKKNLEQPLFIVASENDELIDTEKSVDFFMRQTNPLNKLIYYSNDHKKFQDSRIEVTPSALSSQNILDYSHICIPVAPDHFHYGVHSDYQKIPRFFKIGSKRFKNNPDQEIYYGAVSINNLKNHTLKRLSYNPRFSSMTAAMDDFLNSIDMKG